MPTATAIEWPYLFLKLYMKRRPIFLWNSALFKLRPVYRNKSLYRQRFLGYCCIGSAGVSDLTHGSSDSCRKIDCKLYTEGIMRLDWPLRYERSHNSAIASQNKDYITQFISTKKAYLPLAQNSRRWVLCECEIRVLFPSTVQLETEKVAVVERIRLYNTSRGLSNRTCATVKSLLGQRELEKEFNVNRKFYNTKLSSFATDPVY